VKMSLVPMYPGRVPTSFPPMNSPGLTTLQIVAGPRRPPEATAQSPQLLALEPDTKASDSSLLCTVTSGAIDCILHPLPIACRETAPAAVRVRPL